MLSAIIEQAQSASMNSNSSINILNVLSYSFRTHCLRGCDAYGFSLDCFQRAFGLLGNFVMYRDNSGMIRISIEIYIEVL